MTRPATARGAATGQRDVDATRDTTASMIAHTYHGEAMMDEGGNGLAETRRED